MTNNTVLGIIGGSGIYNMPGIEQIETVEMHTPYGDPSSPITTGVLSGTPVAFLARHGIGHRISPTNVNYRANIYALKELGVTQIISVSACGSLRDDYAPGDIIIPNQIFDLTSRRERSFFQEDIVVHVGVADPFCQSLSNLLDESVRQAGGKVHKGGVYITIEGPRFSTRGESNLYRSWGISAVGMTASPEVFLAREAEMCYATMAHVTDYDVWHVSEAPVSVEMVIATLQKNTKLAQDAISNLAAKVQDDPACACHSSLKDAVITNPDHISAESKHKYGLLLGKYL